MSQSHAPIPSLPVRLSRAARALAKILRDPNQLDQVFVLGESLNAGRLPRLVDKLEAADPEIRRLLAERPCIDSRHVDFDALEALPDGTLGREYVRFLRDNAITPDVFKPPSIGNERASYVMQRIRQTHDLWHVLTGYTPDVTGELLLQGFTFAQLGAPSALLLASLGGLRHGRRTPRFWRRMRTAYVRGKATRKLAGFYWEDHWAEPVSVLRERLCCAREAPSS